MLKDYIKNILIYTSVITVFAAIMPNNSFKKYISFLMGLVLLEMIAGPILEVIG